MVLCDAADVVNNKLYILGGGWTHLFAAGTRSAHAVAMIFSFDWSEANKPHTVTIELRDEDGELVHDPDDDSPVSKSTGIEVGRPPGSKPGSSFNVPTIFNLTNFEFASGGYEWSVQVNGAVMAKTPFRVSEPPASG